MSRSIRLDLAERGIVPGLALRPAVGIAGASALERRLLREQVGVRPDDRERRPELVRHERDKLGTSPIEGSQLLGLGLGLALQPDPLDEPGEDVGDRSELVRVGRAERPRSLGLDVEDADDAVVPDERDREHRGDEPLLIDAADPQEARVARDVRDDERATLGGDQAGHALAERDPGTSDLILVEPVRRRERQVPSIAIEQVERGDVGVQRVPGLVDDRREQLFPRPGRRREPDDAMEELELLELLGRWLGGRGRTWRIGLDRGHRPGDGRHAHHDTSLGRRTGPARPSQRCEPVAERLPLGPTPRQRIRR